MMASAEKCNFEDSTCGGRDGACHGRGPSFRGEDEARVIASNLSEDSSISAGRGRKECAGDE